MRAVIQRVTEADVSVEGKITGSWCDNALCMEIELLSFFITGFGISGAITVFTKRNRYLLRR